MVAVPVISQEDISQSFWEGYEIMVFICSRYVRIIILEKKDALMYLLYAFVLLVLLNFIIL